MNRIKTLGALLLIIFLWVSCTQDNSKIKPIVVSTPSVFNKEYLTIGTFNLEWLGDGHRDRKERDSSDYAHIAEVIKEIDADIIGLQEIENKKALKILLNHLPEYQYVMGTTGGPQKLAIIYKKNIAIASYGDYFPLMVTPHKTKAGLWIYVKAGNFDFHLLNVHLKSSSHWDNSSDLRTRSYLMRVAQARAITNWADSILANSDEEDIIIVGDFNDYPKNRKKKTLAPITDDYNLIFLTDEMRSCKYYHHYTIDQIVISDTTSLRFVNNSEFMFNVDNAFSKYDVEGISDHCPVIAKFDVELPDNDPPLNVATK